MAPGMDGSVHREEARMLRPSAPQGLDSTPSGRGLDLRRLLALAWPERWFLAVASLGLVVSSSANLVIIGVAGIQCCDITGCDSLMFPCLLH